MRILLLTAVLLGGPHYDATPGGGGGSGDVTDVFDCASGNCQSIAQGATDLLDMSACDASTATEGLILPQHATACAGGVAEGQICWEADDDTLYIGNGATLTEVGTGASHPAATNLALNDDVTFTLGTGTDVVCQWETDTTPDSLTCDTAGPVCWSVAGVCDPADFDDALYIISEGETAYTNTNHDIGLVVEAIGSAGVQSIAVLAVAKTDGVSSHATAVEAVSKVTVTGDSGEAIAGSFYSIDVHAGADNIGVKLNALNGANDYAFEIVNGNALNAQPFEWFIADDQTDSFAISGDGGDDDIFYVSSDSSDPLIGTIGDLEVGDDADIAGTLDVGELTTFDGPAAFSLATTATVGANAFTWDLTDKSIQQVNLEACTGGGDCTATLNGEVAGGSYMFIITQGASVETVAWAGGTFLWPAGSEPTTTATDDAIDVVNCIATAVGAFMCWTAQDMQEAA